MEDEHVKNRISNSFDKIIIVFVELLRIVSKEFLPLDKSKGIIIEQEDFSQMISEYFQKLLMDKKYEDFIEEFNCLYNTKSDFCEDLVKLNKLIIPLSQDKIKKIYSIVQLVLLISDNTSSNNDSQQKANFNKNVLSNNENALFKIPSADKIMTSSRINSTKDLKIKEDKEYLEVENSSKTNILSRKKQKSDRTNDKSYDELGGENPPIINSSYINQINSYPYENKNLLKSELGSISTTNTTKCKTKFSTNLNNIDNNSNINKVFSCGDNININQYKSNILNSKTKLINSVKLFELISTEKKNNNFLSRSRNDV